MPLKTKSAVKRFGVRYGRTIRDKVAKIEDELRKKKKCPYCSAVKVKRLASGIWRCRKCESKFTGAAYDLKKKIKEEVEEGEKIGN